MYKKIKSVALSTLIAMTFCSISPQVAQASVLENMVKGAAAYVYVGSVINDMDENQQEESLKNTQKQTGVYENVNYQNRAKNMVQRLEDTKYVKRTYEVYVTPNEDYNAFMTIGRVMGINKGIMDAMDDDTLAYVVGHELAHGENHDITKGVKKQIGLSTALAMAVDGGGVASQIVAGVAGGFITNQVFTMNQEKNADELGFKIFTAAGYNPGGAAASMAIIRDKYGDNYTEGLTQVLMPNNHPKTSDRIKANVERMKEYSKGHVDVIDKTVYVNGKEVYAPPAKGRYSGEVRAYLMAGKLARYYHDHRTREMPIVDVEGSKVILAGEQIVGTDSSNEAYEVGKKLQMAMYAPKPKTKKAKKRKKNKREEVKQIKKVERKKVELLKDIKI